METIKSDMGLSIGQFFSPNKKKVERMLEGAKILMGRIDEVLDKPMDENNPHYCCGDFMEDLIEKLADFAIELEFYEREFLAKAAAWDALPDEGDEESRNGFIMGYLAALKKQI